MVSEQRTIFERVEEARRCAPPAADSREALLSAANELCEGKWIEIRDLVLSGGYRPDLIEDLAREGTALADLAWAIQLPPEDPWSLDIEEIEEALGLPPGGTMDRRTAAAAAECLAQHGTMQTAAFADYLRSGCLAEDVELTIAEARAKAGLQALASEKREAAGAAASDHEPYATPPHEER